MELSVVSTVTDMASRTSGREQTLEHRKKVALTIICVQLMVSLLGFSIAMRAYVTTTNIKAGAFWSHLVLLLACLFLLIGVCQQQQQQQQQERSWMVIGMVANVFGILLAFIGTLVDGAQAGHIAQTQFESCAYSLEKQEVSCDKPGVMDDSNCSMMVHDNSCYCCSVYKESHCDHIGNSLSSQPSLFQGVESCRQVALEYQLLLWSSMTLNLVQFVVATVTVSLVGRYKTLLTQSLHPTTTTTIQHNIVGPSVISSRVEGQPVMIINQQTVGYYPGIIQPPAYSEVVGIGPPPVQPGNHGNHSLTPVDTVVLRGDTTDNSQNIDNIPPDYADSNSSQPLTSRRLHQVQAERSEPMERQIQSSADRISQLNTLQREPSLPPPYSP